MPEPPRLEGLGVQAPPPFVSIIGLAAGRTLGTNADGTEAVVCDRGGVVDIAKWTLSTGFSSVTTTKDPLCYLGSVTCS